MVTGELDGSEGGGVSVDCELNGNAGGGDESIRTLFAGRGLSSMVVAWRGSLGDGGGRPHTGRVRGDPADTSGHALLSAL